MLPFLDISSNIQEIKNSKTNKKSSLDTKEEKSDFGDFLNNFLSISKEEKGELKKDAKINSKENLLSPHKENKEVKNGFLQTLDEKYNLLDNFKAKTTKDINFKKEGLKNTKEDLINFKEVKSNPHKEVELKLDLKEVKTRDLKQEAQNLQEKVKTLKDVIGVAEELKLNLKQVKLENKQAQNTNQTPNISEKFFVNIKKELPKSTNLFNQILQDKELIKDNKEAKKDNKILKNIQEPLNIKEMVEKKYDKDLKEIKESKKQGVENINKDVKKEIKEEVQVVDNKTINNKKLSKDQDKNEMEIKEVKKPDENLKENKEINLPQQKEMKNKEVKEEKSKKTQKQKDDGSQIEIPKEKESKQAKVIEEVKESKKQEFSFKEDKIKNEEVFKENINKEQENAKRTENLKEMPIKEVQKEGLKEAVKEVVFNTGFKKDEKISKETPQDKKVSKDKYKQGDLFEMLKNPNLEDFKNITQNHEEQRAREVDFLNNLLRTENTKEKMVSKETQEIVQTKEKEKEKNQNEAIGANFQTQVQRERFSPLQTFSYFSSNLKDVIANYRPPVTKLTLELNPQNLGSVELTLIKRGDNIHIQIGSNPQALQLFMKYSEEFKKELSNMGFNDITMDFKDIQGNSIDFDFSGNSGGSFGGNSGNNHNSQQQDSKKWNENGLSAYKEANEVQKEVAQLELSFSYYA